MAKEVAISEDSFLTFTTLDDMASARTRNVVASHASRVGRQRRNVIDIQPNQIVRSFLAWRHGAAPRTKAKTKSSDTYPQPSPQPKDRDDLDLTYMYNQSDHLFIGGQIGGLRTEPFDAYPIDGSRHVNETFDYFVQYYSILDAHYTTPVGKAYFRCLIDEASFFHQVIAFALTLQLHATKKLDQTYKSRELWYHSSKATQELQKRLSTPGQRYTDAVLITMVAMAATACLLPDGFLALDAHMNGLRRVTALRGELDGEGLPGYIKTRLAQLEGAWASTKKVYESTHSSKSTPGQKTAHERQGKLKHSQGRKSVRYFKHPVPHHIGKKIAKLPLGFQKLALSLRLCEQVIGDIHDIYIRTINVDEIEQAITFEMLDTSAAEITELERLLLSTLREYNQYVSKKALGRRNPIFGVIDSAQIQDLDTKTLEKETEMDCVLWACLMLRATSTEDTPINRWARLFLQNKPVNEEKKAELETSFIPIPHLYYHGNSG